MSSMIVFVTDVYTLCAVVCTRTFHRARVLSAIYVNNRRLQDYTIHVSPGAKRNSKTKR